STRDSALIDTKELIQSIVEEYEFDGGILFKWAAPLTDDYGNEECHEIMKMEFTPNTLSEINYENISKEACREIADDAKFHPSIQYRTTQKPLARISPRAFSCLKTQSQIFDGAKSLVRLLHVISQHIDVSPNHIHRFMSENPLQRKYIRSILYAHLGESVAKCMRTTSHILNISHAPILGDSPTNAISIHLLVIVRNKEPIDGRSSS